MDYALKVELILIGKTVKNAEQVEANQEAGCVLAKEKGYFNLHESILRVRGDLVAGHFIDDPVKIRQELVSV